MKNLIRCSICLALLLSCSSEDSVVDSVTYCLRPASSIEYIYPPNDDYYGPVEETIADFIKSSLSRDGILYYNVKVSDQNSSCKDGYSITILCKGTCDSQVISFGRVHTFWTDIFHAQQAIPGIYACKADPDCWNPSPAKEDPNWWKPFLPHGLPMLNQWSVQLLNYPPNEAYINKDYIGDPTSARWERMLEQAEVPGTPQQWEAIVDIHPIAAPGAGQSDFMPDALVYFDSSSYGFYISSMVELLLTSSSRIPHGTTRTLPLGVFGSPARAYWEQVIGQDLHVGDAGVEVGLYPGSLSDVPWVVLNHPDVALLSSCSPDKYGETIVNAEQKDFAGICMLKTFLDDPSLNSSTVKSTCEDKWIKNPGSDELYQICIAARMDMRPFANRCETTQDASAYCEKYGNNPCDTEKCE